MSFPWQAERAIEPELALELIKIQFPFLKPRQLTLLGVGWDNSAFLLDEKYIFRFPRRASALALLQKESSILPKIAPLLSLPIPFPKWLGKPSKYFPWPFSGYAFLPGKTACSVLLTQAQKAALAEPLAKFLRSLHEIKLANCNLPNQCQSRIEGSSLTNKIFANLQKIADLKLLDNRAVIERAVGLCQTFSPPTHHTIVHGDLYMRHLLIDSSHRLAGVIDWGDLHLSDPAIDLSIAHSFLPATSHETFRKSYGEISSSTWTLAKLRAIYSNTMLIIFGHHTKEEALLKAGKQSLKKIAEDT